MTVDEEKESVRFGVTLTSPLWCRSSLQVTEEVREHLKTPIFDNW